MCRCILYPCNFLCFAHMGQIWKDQFQKSATDSFRNMNPYSLIAEAIRGKVRCRIHGKAILPTPWENKKHNRPMCLKWFCALGMFVLLRFLPVLSAARKPEVVVRWDIGVELGDATNLPHVEDEFGELSGRTTLTWIELIFFSIICSDMQCRFETHCKRSLAGLNKKRIAYFHFTKEDSEVDGIRFAIDFHTASA